MIKLLNIVIQHCAANGCILDLANYQGGALCEVHEHEFGKRCCVRGCKEASVPDTMACTDHQSLWKKYKLDHSAGSLAKSKRMLNHQQENLKQNPKDKHKSQPHDQSPAKVKKTKHFFGPATFYCVETICNLCGVVEAWEKFAKSESESNKYPGFCKQDSQKNHAQTIFALIKVADCLNILLHKVTGINGHKQHNLQLTAITIKIITRLISFVTSLNLFQTCFYSGCFQRDF